jgi:hypothetical protein
VFCLFDANNNTLTAIFKADNTQKMKPDQLYQELISLAERLQVTVSEQNLKTSGVKVKSGFCKVRGQDMVVLDKHKSILDKIRLLATQLAAIPHDDLYIKPAVRELLEKYRES